MSSLDALPFLLLALACGGGGGEMRATGESDRMPLRFVKPAG